MTIVSCPRCNDQVRLPSQAAASTAKVRCPLCAEEFVLAEVLEKLPPALILVDVLPAADPAIFPSGARHGELLEANDSLANALDRAEATPDLHDLAPSITESMDEISLAAFDGDGPSAKARDRAGISTAGLSEEDDLAASLTAPRPQFKAVPRPKRREKSAVVEIIKVVMGGAVGLALAVVVLWWLPFERDLDIMKLGPTLSRNPYTRVIVPPRYWDKEVKKSLQGDDSGTAARDEAAKDVGGGKKDKPEEVKKSNPNESNVAKANGETKAKVGVKDESATKPDELSTTDEAKMKPDGGKGDKPLIVDDEPAPKTTPPESNPGDAPADKSTGGKPTPDKPTSSDEKPGDEMPPKKEDGETKPGPTKPDNEKPVETKSTAAANPADLDASLAKAKEAVAAFGAAPMDDKEARMKAAQSMVSAAGAIGEVISRLNLDDADNAAKVPALDDWMTDFGQNLKRRQIAGRLAEQQLDGPGAGGILLAGEVKNFQSLGSLFETTVELTASKTNRQVSIITPINPQDFCQVGDQVLVVGVIVREPKGKLKGYSGEAPVVVVGGHTKSIKAE